MTKIKICGLMRETDIDAVNAAKPDYVGFVFAESRRRVTPERASELRRALAPGIVPVGVFVNSPLRDIMSLLDSGTIEIAQLHGGEHDDYISVLRDCGATVIQAIRHGRGDVPCALADFHLFDAPRGGSGETFDHRTIQSTDRPHFLAGGISAQNLAAALALNPFAVDISSGAETDGLKDFSKIQELVNICRGAHCASAN
ncbi:MAG: phosphoribosylanthranilate isomerase [Oscillospiraceae bacterium]|jgi:phosphoribosylanthranilate isomerase|nr:phosphoribosylanthranilate isomerase [Oscillospiraceae bacterium]